MNYSDYKIIEGHTENLNIFSQKATNTAIQGIEWFEYRPVSQLSSTTSALEFTIPSVGSHYLNLKQTRLHLKLKIVNEDGTDLAEKEKVALINLPHCGIFNQVD
jgi:hypothetical protein